MLDSITASVGKGQEELPDKMNVKSRGRGEMAEWLKARASKACIP
jgi:hypothetical protein